MAHQSGPRREAIRVLSQNLWVGLASVNRQARCDEFATLLRDYDVVMVQEIGCLAVAGKETLGFREWLMARLRREGFSYFAFPPLPFMGACTGLLICSRLRLRNPEHVIFKQFSGLEKISGKGAVLVRLDIKGAPPLHLLNVHLQKNSGSTSVEARRSQLEQVVSLLAGRVDVAIGGDFNIDGRSDVEEYTSMMQALAPVEDPLGRTDLLSTPITCPVAKSRQDYVLMHNPKRWEAAPGSAAVRKLGAGVQGVSDHFAVECSFVSTSTL